LGHRNREGKGGERKIQALKAQGRQAEEKSNDETGCPGCRYRPVVGDVGLIHQDRGRICADSIKSAVTERELSVEAGEQVQSENCHGVDQGERELKNQEAFDCERQ